MTETSLHAPRPAIANEEATALHPPVTDWVHDFDHTDPRWTENPFPIWDELREQCPVVHTKRFLGCYLPTTYEAVKQISYDTEHFSSRRVVVRNIRPEPPAPSPPITSDPPAHKPAKQLLLPPFTPDAMKKLEPRVRAICNELIDEFIDQTADAMPRRATPSTFRFARSPTCSAFRKKTANSSSNGSTRFSSSASPTTRC